MIDFRCLADTLRSRAAPVSRAEYITMGLLLATVKYTVEAAVFYATTGSLCAPLDFISPSLTTRNELLRGAPEWLGVAWMIWTLPFVWIALMLSSRRAEDAGRSPWHGLWVLTPYLNLVAIAVLAALPTQPAQKQIAEAPQASISSNKLSNQPLVTALAAIGIAAVYSLVVSTLSVYLLGDYGVVLFVGTPLVAGAASGYLLNRGEEHSGLATAGHAFGVVLLVMGTLLVIGWEGVICLAMAAPVMVPPVLAGALLGREIALKVASQTDANERGLAGALLLLPVLGLAESVLNESPEMSVETAVVIDASPQQVWDVVIAFPPIDAPEPWLFRLGIASPQSACIEGEGVGAVRHCVFTTGEFVEPITAWDAPHRLAFDVIEQPEPMVELTPYREIHPPHLDGALRSTRGEFRLEPLGDGRTRLVGRTWYRLEMAPSVYWAAWTDWILHQVHGRVLEHIARVAERDRRLARR